MYVQVTKALSQVNKERPAPEDAASALSRALLSVGQGGGAVAAAPPAPAPAPKPEEQEQEEAEQEEEEQDGGDYEDGLETDSLDEEDDEDEEGGE